jgi:hypothetical protein
LKLIRVQDVGLWEADDSEILTWAAAQNYILLTHDWATVPDFTFQRIAAGQSMPDIFVVNDRLSLRQAIDKLLFLDEYSEQDEWDRMGPITLSQLIAISEMPLEQILR